MKSAEQAETGQLEKLLARIGEGLDTFLTFKHPDALDPSLHWREELDRPLPVHGVGIDEVTSELLAQVIPNGAAIIRPGFTGFITTGSTTAPVLATTAASVASGQRYSHTAFNFLEELSLNWLAEMLGIAGMKGVYSSGGSIANLIALGGARQYAFEKCGRDPSADGIDRPVAVYASQECHHTIQRSCGVLGVGRHAVRSIVCDEHGRLDIEALKSTLAADLKSGILPMAIVANAGTTDSGAIDPIAEMGQIARSHGIWFHVDGAYGLPGILDDRIRHLYAGVELADSVIVDPHKWLGANVGISATFVRDRQILHRAFTQEPANYLEGTIDQGGTNAPVITHSMDDFGIPYYDFSLELSAPCRGVAVWALIREIGVDGMRARIRRHNDMARHVADTAKSHPKLELVREPTLSVCCFRYVPAGISDINKFNQALYRRLVRENQHIPSTTLVDGKLALRPCFIGARTDHEHAQGLIEAVLRIGGELERAA